MIYVNHLIQFIDIVADPRIIIGLLAHLGTVRYVRISCMGIAYTSTGHAPGRIRLNDKSLPATRSPHIPRVHVRRYLLIDDTDTGIATDIRLRFGGGVIQEREFLHLTVREVIPVSRFFFYQYFIRSQIVRVLIEKNRKSVSINPASRSI